jgi:hypothetical protein
VAAGRGRGGIHRQGWFIRPQHNRSSAHTTGAPDALELAPSESGDDARAAADETAPPDSFDQVLRRAAESRDHERDPDDRDG